MKKLALCLILFLVSVPLSAGILGLSAGITGGVEMWDPNTEGSETQTFTGIGLTATISPPFIPINIRGDLEYAWKSYTDEDVKISDIFILLGLERSIAPPLSPLSLYLGLGGEMSILDNGDGESMTDYGFLIYGGINLNVGLMAVFAETGYGIIFMDRGNLTHIPIRGGIKVSI